MKKICVMILLTPLFLGTTYVLMENGVETGKIEEEDGKNEVILVDGTAQKKVHDPREVLEAAPAAKSQAARQEATLSASDPIPELQQPPEVITLDSGIGNAGIAGDQNLAHKIPDKVQTWVTEDGREVIQVTGQMSPEYYAQKRAESEEKRQIKRELQAGRFAVLPLAREKYHAVKSDQKPFTHRVHSENFLIEMENNKVLAVETAQLLESFYRLLSREVQGLSRRPRGELELSVKIFQGRAGYLDYCKQLKHDCEHTIGFTSLTGLEKSEVTFYWDEQGERNYFRVLFHEATHQLLDSHTQRIFPRWLTEGLAVYFETARFDEKEIYLPVHFVNRYEESMKTYLTNKGDPKAIFTWGARIEDETPYYGLSGSFLFFLMRAQTYRHYVKDFITQLQDGIPTDQFGASFTQGARERLWQDWYRTFSDYAVLPGTGLFYFEE